MLRKKFFKTNDPTEVNPYGSDNSVVSTQQI